MSKQSQTPLPPGISKPALRALASAGITSLDDLTGFSERELLALHGMGPKVIGILREALKAEGKKLASTKQV